ncbi:hypothetical protein [Streptomyces sp. NPDC048192]|uniref:hypothetical protein n=1 Tax=Streptomyces sp. NPDC048192 TaxID=3365510 RepID=UPI003715E483
MALLPLGRGSGDAESRPPKNGVFLWACVLTLICGATALLVFLGMPVAAAVTTVSSLALVATQVVSTHQGGGKDDSGQSVAAGSAGEPSVAPGLPGDASSGPKKGAIEQSREGGDDGQA